MPTLSRPTPPRLALVFSGHGSQWPGMGRGLLAEPAFHAAIERWDAAIERHGGWSLLRELEAPAPVSRLGEVEIAQPAIVAVEVALAELWRSWGVEPDAVVGYSIGDVAACCFAGALSLEEAARVICRQGALLRGLRGRGRMLMAELPEEQVRAALGPLTPQPPLPSPPAGRERGRTAFGKIAIAVYGGPACTVLSGDPDELEAVRALLAGRGAFLRWVATDVACHSPQMDGLAAVLERDLADLRPRPCRLPIYSGLTGDRLDGTAFSASYWARSLREAVRFADAVRRLHGERFGLFVEVSPHPQILPALRGCLGWKPPTVVPSLRRGRDEREELLASHAALVEAGYQPTRPAPVAPSLAQPLVSVADRAPDRAALLAASPFERRRLLETALRHAVAAVLRVTPEEIDPEISLGRLGLDSLAAMEVRHGLAERLGVRISTAALLGDGGVWELSRELARAEAAGAATREAEDGPAGEAPLSRGQRALWFLHRLAPESTAYHLAFALRILSPLDTAALGRALAALAERHPALRATIAAPDGVPVQRIGENGLIELEILEIESVEPTAGSLEARLAAAARRPFDLAAGPALRVLVLRRGFADHALLLAMHHALADFWSIAVLVRELGRLYREETGGPAAALPSLDRSHAGWVAQQEAMLAGAEGERAWEHWRGQLAGLTDLELPIDRPRPTAQTFRGDRCALRLDAALAADLRAVARADGATLFMALAAAFQALLHRVTGQDDVPVGTATAGRDEPGLDGLVGYFVNPVVLRGDLAGDPGFADLLARTRRTALAAFEHQGFPFPLLVERLRPHRDASRSPLFQAMLLLEKAPRPEEQGLAACLVGRAGAPVELGGMRAESLPLPERGAQFDLTLTAAELDGALDLALQYSTDLFDAATALRLLGHLRTLAAAAVADPGRPLAELPLLSAGELGQLLVEWNDTAVHDARDQICLHELIACQAARTPRAVAVSHGGAALTYSELMQRADDLARRLGGLGAGPEVLVAVCLERGLDLVVTLLAVLRTGGAYLPLDPDYPAERLALLLEDSGAALLVTQRSLCDRLPGVSSNVTLTPIPSPGRRECGWERGPGGEGPGGPASTVISRLCLEDAATLPLPPSRDGWETAADPDNLAYVLYTSGSTGRPKGVQIHHRALVNFLRSMAARPGLGAADTLLAVTTLSFDIAGLEIFGPLVTGGRAVLASREEASDPVRLARAIDAAGATVVQATPVTWRMLIASGWSPRAGLKALCGGEALPPDLAAALTAGLAPDNAELWNLYGPTETTVWSSAQRVTPSGSGRSIPIGRPIDNTALHVLDARLAPVPIGVAGELAIGGAGLSRGYLRRPGLTAERFVPNPWGVPGERLYRTGDLARRLPGGEIEVLGRTDQQVKVRGFRIEPGEVEACLIRHPEVASAVVVAHGETAGERRLVAYFVPAGSAGAAPPAAAALRDHLAACLPEPWVPSLFVPLAALPLTPNGKVDRRALPAPAAPTAAPGSAKSQIAPAPPRTPAEIVLAGIWERVLGLGAVRTDDNFFVVGGDSVRALQVVFEARRAGLELAPRDLFRHRTLAALAAAVERTGGTASPELRHAVLPPLPAGRLTVLGIEPAGIADSFPLSPVQQGMLLHSLGRPGTYLQQVVWTLSGDLQAFEPAAFRRAWEELAARHEALRVSVAWEALERPHLLVHRAAELPWQEIDWSALPEDRREAALESFLAADRGRGFDTRRPPLARWTLVRMGAASWRLVWSFHHLILDGWSVQILLRELAAAPHPPGGEGSLRSFAEWQAGLDLTEAERFWRGNLAGFTVPTPLPWGHPVSAERRREPGTERAEARLPLGEAATAALGAFARRHGLTLNILVQGAWALLLSRCSGEGDIVFGAVTSGRSAPLLEMGSRTGLFLNTLPRRVRVGPQKALLPWLRALQVGQVELERTEHAPLVDIQRWSEVNAPRSLFESILIFESYPPSGLGGEVRFHEATHYPLALVALPGRDLLLQVSHDPGRLDGAAARRLLAHLAVLLEAMHRLETPETAQLGDLPSLTTAEHHQIVTEWNTAGGETPTEICLHRLFEAQVERTPDAVALVAGEERLSYAELDRRAGRLARRLLARCVGPEVRVGLCAGRAAGLVVGLLGILKAGGAYVPLDPTYPRERLAAILADAGAEIVVTESRRRADLPSGALRCVFLDQDEDEAPDSEEIRQSHRSSALTPGPSPISHPPSPREREEKFEEARSLSPLSRRGRGWEMGEGPGVRALPGVAADFGEPLPDNVYPDNASPHNLAYIIYTSGSTGRPKGVAIEHRSAASLLRWAHRVFSPAELAGVLAAASIAFDLSVFEILAPLTAGGKVVLAESVLALPGLPAAAEVTMVGTVPSAMAELLRQGALPPSVRTVHLGGEPVPRPIADAVLRLGAVERLLHFYGPSEDTTFSTWDLMRAGEAGPPPIGRPLDAGRVHVLDPRMRPVAPGIDGEIFLAGAGLARGYFGRPDLTAERFLPDPLSREPGGRLYRTGDRSRLRPDGRLEILGRADHQVKIRGCRIEPGDIEATLLRHPTVAAAVVLPREERPGDLRLVAYVATAPKVPGSPSRREALRGLCREQLPAYMIPSVFVLLAALPLTPNGKVDRAALPWSPTEPGDTAAVAVPGAPPRAGLEAALAEIWKETLGAERVGRHESFFDLGGHSLLLFRVQGLLRERLGRDVSPLDLLRHTTVAALARHLGSTDRPPAPASAAGDSLRDAARDGGRSALADQLSRRRALRGAPVGGLR